MFWPAPSRFRPLLHRPIQQMSQDFGCIRVENLSFKSYQAALWVTSRSFLGLVRASVRALKDPRSCNYEQRNIPKTWTTYPNSEEYRKKKCSLYWRFDWFLSNDNLRKATSRGGNKATREREHPKVPIIIKPFHSQIQKVHSSNLLKKNEYVM